MLWHVANAALLWRQVMAPGTVVERLAIEHNAARHLAVWCRRWLATSGSSQLPRGQRGPRLLSGTKSDIEMKTGEAFLEAHFKCRHRTLRGIERPAYTRGHCIGTALSSLFQDVASICNVNYRRLWINYYCAPYCCRKPEIS